MNTEDFNDWQDEDDESEEDFVPEAYDDEDDDSDDSDDNDGDGDIDNDNDNDNDDDDLPTFLQGDLIMDRAKGLCYENDGNFSLVSQNSTFSIGTPLLDSPVVFAGWIKDPGVWMEFEVYFSKQLLSTCTDPLEMKLLEAQEKKLPVASIDDNKESSFAKKSGNDTIYGKWMEGRKTPTKGNLKAPPAYSLIDKGDNAKETTGCGKSNAEKSVRDDSVFVVSGTQIDNNKKDSRKIEFRGLYRPSSTSIKRLHLICSIQANDGAASSAAMTSGAVAATSVAAAASKKRNRSDVDDDDYIGATSGVAYQELFALHDDSRLSTEDLRRKYYGSGDRKAEDTNTKKHASKGTCNTSSNKKYDEDDDGDDAYGF
jgi:hypothetical protein